MDKDLEWAKDNLYDYISDGLYSYTLWIGAGLTIQLGRVGSSGERICNWPELVALMQSEGGMPHNLRRPYQSRLQECLDLLKQDRFQRILREQILNKLCSIINSSSCLDPPNELRQIAQLGLMANPIVNFNIEHLTSFALAMPGGPCATRCLRKDPKLHYVQNFSVQGRPQRLIYHPHGLINDSGLCVMTRNDYDLLPQTLALRMAVHAAFDSVLFIVGMSMEDAYLRRLLEKHYLDIFEIVWFAKKSDLQARPISNWAKRMSKKMKHFHVVTFVDWPDFWNFVSDNFHKVDEGALGQTWKRIRSDARNINSSRTSSPSRPNLGLM